MKRENIVLSLLKRRSQTCPERGDATTMGSSCKHQNTNPYPLFFFPFFFNPFMCLMFGCLTFYFSCIYIRWVCSSLYLDALEVDLDLILVFSHLGFCLLSYTGLLGFVQIISGFLETWEVIKSLTIPKNLFFLPLKSVEIHV